MEYSWESKQQQAILFYRAVRAVKSWDKALVLLSGWEVRSAGDLSAGKVARIGWRGSIKKGGLVESSAMVDLASSKGMIKSLVISTPNLALVRRFLTPQNVSGHRCCQPACVPFPETPGSPDRHSVQRSYARHRG
jgi:hypothetical protein